jgi:hypothetical protein
MKNITLGIFLFFCFSCQKEKATSLRLNPEIMSLVKKFNELLIKEELLQEKRYVICVHIENRFDTVKVYIAPLTNYNDIIKLGKPTFVDSVDKRRVYIYAPQTQYLYPNKAEIRIDPTYFSKTDTTIGCMIPHWTFKKFGKDSTVTYTNLEDSPISRWLLPSQPPIPVKFIPPKIDRK